MDIHCAVESLRVVGLKNSKNVWQWLRDSDLEVLGLVMMLFLHLKLPSKRPRKSFPSVSAKLEIPFSGIGNVSREKLKMSQCNTSLLRQLLQKRYPLQVYYAQVDGYLDRNVFSDGCIIHANGVVSMHNARRWGLLNHRAVRCYQ